jgi:hypothetical protein
VQEGEGNEHMRSPLDDLGASPRPRSRRGRNQARQLRGIRTAPRAETGGLRPAEPLMW